ncbi:Predicted arabinose efflux permease, MFS family [Micromonospora pallida]|uniref:Predicted arabinose efflux permease, MFS family n=2 Tax=Micromonospora pallida TaxID=145854 RepID=A0A1C6RWN3_9ACTN|nr:Predicted arabinose efflux permease, MFS family [Micromonospora pallida]
MESLGSGPRHGLAGDTAFKVYVAGQAVSSFGTFMEYTALYWLVNRVAGGNALILSLVAAVQFLPMLVLSRPVGRVVGRMSRRRTLLITQYAQMAVSVLLAVPLLVFGWASAWWIGAMALLLGCVHVVDSPARQMFMKDLVGIERLRRAVGTYSTAVGGARIGGPAVAGFLIAAVGEGWVFVLNAVSYLAVVFSLHYVRRVRGDSTGGATAAGQGPGSGARLNRIPQAIRPALLLTLLLGGFAYQFQITGPLMVVTVLHDDSVTYGLIGMCTAVGAIVGSIISARRSTPTTGEYVTWATAFGIVALFAAMATSSVWFGAAMAGVGMALSLFTTTVVVFIQHRASDSEQGPALAAYNAAYMGFIPLGAVVVGATAEYFGVRWGIALPSVALLVAAGYAAIRLRTTPAIGPEEEPEVSTDPFARNAQGAS